VTRRRRPALRLLSVDWDYFFPVPVPGQPDHALYDWSHADSPFFRDLVWDGRAAAFLANGRDLPTTTGADVGFWSRFAFAPGARLIVADSHACLALPALLEGVAEVVSFDAHHDAGYKPESLAVVERGRWHCDTWAILYQGEGAHVDVRYPPWLDRPGRTPGDREAGPLVDVLLSRTIDQGGPEPGPFDRAFLCRSAGWMPPWLDDRFDALVAACPIPVEPLDRSPTDRRAFDLAEVALRAEQVRRLADPDSDVRRTLRALSEETR
jgi:hypothetical protein